MWGGLVHCGKCNALHHGFTCTVCGHKPDVEPHMMVIDGVRVPSYIQAGAVPYSVFVLLDLIRFECERPPTVPASGRAHPASERLVIVILFWTLIEGLMERFYTAAFADLPGELAQELLQRFPSIGGRLDRLYRRRWGMTFWDDLTEAGYPDAAKHLRAVQAARNAFVHGNPKAIDDALVQVTLDQLRNTQLGWIAVFNRRCSGMTKKVPLYDGDMALMLKKPGEV